MLKEVVDFSEHQPRNDDESKPKHSDFSIDHILNRAGNCDTQRARINLSDVCNEFKHSFTNECLPMFSWLNYTRYKPPRFPRSSKLGPIKRTPGRLPRVPFTPAQLGSLENAYKQSSYLSSEDANRLADRLDLTSTRVKIWFQNRRARERRESRDNDDNTTLDLSVSQEQCNLMYSNLKYELSQEKLN